MTAVKRHSHTHVGEEIGQHLRLLCTGIQVLEKGCHHLKAVKTILKLGPQNHTVCAHHFGVIWGYLMILILLEMFTEDQANVLISTSKSQSYEGL